MMAEEEDEEEEEEEEPENESCTNTPSLPGSIHPVSRAKNKLPEAQRGHMPS